MRLLTTLSLIAASLYFQSCATVNFKDLDRYAEKAMEPGAENFVIMDNGEKIEGKKLRRNRKWSLDGKKIDPNKVTAYQDKWGYGEGDVTRMIKGKKLDMYYHVQDNSRLETSYSSTTKSYTSTSKGGTQTTFYMKQPGGKIEGMTYNSLKRVVADCPLALNILQTEFKGTSTERKPDWKTNVYPKLIKVVDAYNNSCP